MRRSDDGYVSATGMFKAIFPYAEAKEEEQERKYVKSLPTTSQEETAGNVWIPPVQALELAEEYQMLPWIQALLDPSDIPISQSPSGTPKDIRPPPRFEFTANKSTLAPPTPTSIPRSTRGRRSASPIKKRAITSPRKRATRQALIAETPCVTDEDIPASAINKAERLQTENGKLEYTKAENVENENGNVENPFTTIEGVEIKKVTQEPPVIFAPIEEPPQLQVNVQQNVEVDNGVETTRTAVELKLPVTHLPSDEETARMIEEAKAMVKTAAEQVAASDSINKSKRKAEDMAADDEDDEAEKKEDERSEEPSAKRAKTEVEVKKGRIRHRALIGISATVALGAIIPYVMGAF